jgi:hypothetical protein
VAAVTILVGIVGVATFSSSGVENLDLLISVYSSLLEASVTVVALVSILISWVVERKINRAWNVLNRIQEYRWMDLPLETSQNAFERMKQRYRICYKNADLPPKWKIGIMSIYFPCAVAGVLALVIIGYLLPGGSIGHIVASAYILAAVAIMLSLIAFGFILYDLMSLKRGWFFILPDSAQINTLDCLRKKIGLDFKVILKLGLITVRTVLNDDGEYCILLYPRFKDLESNFQPILKSKNVQPHRPEPRSFSKDNKGKGDNKKEDGVCIRVTDRDFPPIFQSARKPWVLHVELSEPFREDPRKKEESEKLPQKVRYVFQGETKKRKINVLTDLKMIDVAYLKPEEKQNSYTSEEKWVKIDVRGTKNQIISPPKKEEKRN